MIEAKNRKGGMEGALFFNPGTRFAPEQLEYGQNSISRSLRQLANLEEKILPILIVIEYFFPLEATNHYMMKGPRNI
jgi:hypothetical protein